MLFTEQVKKNRNESTARSSASSRFPIVRGAKARSLPRVSRTRLTMSEMDRDVSVLFGGVDLLVLAVALRRILLDLDDDGDDDDDDDVA
jgi:hypothetical protein